MPHFIDWAENSENRSLVMLHIDYNITMIHLNLIDELSIASEKLHKYLPIFIQCPVFGYQTSLLNVPPKGYFV